MGVYGRLSSHVILGLIAVQAAAMAAWSADPPSDRKLEEIRMRAEAGYVDQQIELGAAYLAGRGVAQDTAQAAHWYQKAAEAGNPEAQNQIGYFYENGIGVPVDQMRAVHWFQLASAAGMPRAKVNLGVSYLNGLGVPRNASTAEQLFQEAVRKGAGLGATFLGMMRLYGLGVPMDKPAAERWFETGVKLHDPEAAYDLGVLYSAQPDHPHDLKRAAELFRFSSGKGYVPSKHSLGMLLVNHPDLGMRDEDAPGLLKQASLAGNWRSSLLLGVLERDGKGVKQDASLAYYYFQLGALQGGVDGKRAAGPDLQALERKLTSEARASTTAQADAWYAEHSVAMMFVFKDGDTNRNFPLAAVADPTAGLNLSK
jgi:TPR repeat protein